ncbi:MAG: tripartite tricarboxylate transporter TctB family protein [Oscillospiraceae bacterium]|nr:tripartite tricarboxylate transporter TctB family protein [Oscillospiraceae bacterium]
MDNNGKKSLLRNSNCQDSIFVGLCSVALLAYSLYHHANDRNTGEWKTSPYLFPVLISVFGLLLAVSLMADALHDLHSVQETANAVEGGAKHNLVGALVFIAASVAYYLLMPLLHFIPATIVFLGGLFVYLGERKWWKILLLSVITTGAVYALFGLGLNVRLP